MITRKTVFYVADKDNLYVNDADGKPIKLDTEQDAWDYAMWLMPIHHQDFHVVRETTEQEVLMRPTTDHDRDYALKMTPFELGQLLEDIIAAGAMSVEWDYTSGIRFGGNYNASEGDDTPAQSAYERGADIAREIEKIHPVEHRNGESEHDYWSFSLGRKA